MKCALIGLPNVGKTTIFSALSHVTAETGNFPFSTLSAKHALVPVTDDRLEAIAKHHSSAKTTPATIEITDIPGLVQGASAGEGLGNRFLASIRESAVLVHVLRCFVDENIVHVDAAADPLRDKRTVELELILADLQSLERRTEKLQKEYRSADKDKRKQMENEQNTIYHLQEILESGQLIAADSTSGELQDYAHSRQLLTVKPVLYACNVSEKMSRAEQDMYDTLVQHIQKDGGALIPICGKLEADIALLDSPEEEEIFLSDIGYSESGLKRVIQECYTMLGLATFFTAGERESRAWSFKRGCTAAQAAGIIHSDFERGFIRAEVYHCRELFELGSEQEIRRKGKLRLEGKEYRVNDGDVMFFRFNV